MREQLREKILNEVSEEIKKSRITAFTIKRSKKRILKADKEYMEGQSKAIEDFAKTKKLTTKNIYAIYYYLDGGDPTKDLPEMTEREYEDIVDGASEAIGVLAYEIGEKYNLSIEHEEYIVTMLTCPDIFCISYEHYVGSDEGEFTIGLECSVEEALEKAIDKTERVVMRRCRRNRRIKK